MLKISRRQGNAGQNHNEIPHTHRRALIRNNRQQQGLTGMWRNCNPNTLLVGLQNGTVTLVNRLAVPELPFDPAILFLGIYLREMKTMATQKLVHECSQQCYS